MDMAKYKECLQELRGHVEAAEGLLLRIDNTSLCTAFDAIKDFLFVEEKKLLWEEKKQMANPFFALRSEVPEAQTILTNCQQSLEKRISEVKSEVELEQLLQPYVQLLEAMSYQNPVKKMDYLVELSGVLPKDLLAYTLMQGNVTLPKIVGEEPVSTTESAKSEKTELQETAQVGMPAEAEENKGKKLPTEEAAAVAREKKQADLSEAEPQEKEVELPEEELEMIYDVSSVQEAVEELTEDMNSESDNKKEATETSEPVSEETVCFFDGLLLPEDCVYGQLEFQSNPKGEKDAGVSQMKSDIKKGRLLKNAILKALQQLAEHSFITASFLQVLLHGLREEQAAGTAEASLQYLHKNGYTERYILNGNETIYCTSLKLRKLLQQKTACQYLGVEQEKKDSENIDLIQYVEPKHVVSRLAWLAIYTQYMSGMNGLCLLKGSRQVRSVFGNASFQMLIRWGKKDPYDIMLGFFDNQLDKSAQLIWQNITRMSQEKGKIRCLTLAGMDRSHVTALHEKMKETETLQYLLMGKIYYYVYEEKSFFTPDWAKVDPVYAPAKEEMSELESGAETTAKVPDVELEAPENVEKEVPDNVESVVTEAEQKEEVQEENEVLEDIGTEKLGADSEPVAVQTAEIPVADPVPEEKVSKQPLILTEKRREEILNQVMDAVCKGSICSATAYLKYWSRIHEELVVDYKQLAYAVHDHSLSMRYTSEQACTLFSGDVSVFRQYLELAVACRTFFYNDIEYDYLAHNLQDMASVTDLMSADLSNILYQLMKFKQDNQKGIDFYADYRTKDQHIMEATLKQLGSEAGDYIANIINKRNSEQKAQKRFIEMKKLIFDPDGDLGTYLSAIQENDKSMLPMLKDYLQEKIILDNQPLVANNISRQKIETMVDEKWEEAGSHVRLMKRTRLMGSLRNNILTAVNKIADLFCRWIELAEQVSAQGETEGQIAYQKVRGGLLEKLSEALTRLEAQEENSLQDQAGQIILSQCLQELQARLQGSYNPSMERYFYIDFLRADHVLLDENYMPDFQHWMYMDEPTAYADLILSYAKESLPSFDERMEEIFEKAGDNYLTATLIDGYLQATGQPSLIKSKGYKLEESIELAKTSINIQKSNFVENLELAQSYGQLDTTRENQKEDILQIVNDCYEYALLSHNFGVFRQVMEYYNQKIKDDARQRGAVLAGEVKQNRLRIDEQAEDAARLKARLDSIEHMIEIQNYTVAEDMLNRWRDQDTEDFDIFTSEDNLKDFIDNYDNYYNPVKNSGVSLLYNWRNKAEHGASRLAESWIRNRQSTNAVKIRNLLQYMGWRVENAVPEPHQDKFQIFRIVLKKALNGKKSNYTHPIAAFGSVAEQDGFRVVCLYGRFDTDSLIETFKELGNSKPTLVLLDFALELGERRRLARKIKRELYGKKVFLLVDRVTIMYLMKHYNETKVNRMLMLITMPFSVYQPYVWESSNIMPAEMFMGRRKELADIENPNGANIVYGGRQLGKSALLKMAVKDIDHDENNNRAILIDIKGRDEKATARRISQELSDQEFFTSSLETEDWNELARAIRKRLRDEKAQKINYFLLMLDEADAFIESCAEVNFKPFDALKDIQSIGMERFKFVIAGLRNIIRFDRDKALSNNSVLTHLTSMTVKPFHASEARELLEVPLSYLGFRFPENNKPLISMILANANYFPGLIQLYCAKLIEAMSATDYAKYDQSETPIYEIKEDHIKKVLASQGFRDQIREKFEITLKLGDDKYYYIIALAMAYLYHQQGYYRGYTPEEVLSVINDFEMHEFDKITVENMAALMDELRELNVFRMNTEGRYLFARYTFFQMMGNKDEVDGKILAMMEEEA